MKNDYSMYVLGIKKETYSIYKIRQKH